MNKYRAKQAEVEAVQLIFENQNEVKQWVGFGSTYSTPPMRQVTGIQFAVNAIALFGDWVIKDEEGGLSVCSPDVFESTYEPASLPPQSATEPQDEGYWQLCPKCNGQGTVSKPPYVPGDVNEWSSTSSVHTCDVCNGAKIIATPQSTPPKE